MIASLIQDQVFYKTFSLCIHKLSISLIDSLSDYTLHNLSILYRVKLGGGVASPSQQLVICSYAFPSCEIAYETQQYFSEILWFSSLIEPLL